MQIIYLDISNKGVVPTIYAKQGDVGRKFQVVLTDSGLPYIPVGGSAFSVWYSGASGEGNYTDIGANSAFSLNGNKVTVEMISQMLSNEGDGVLSLVLNAPNGNQISTWNIPYICEFVPGIDSEEAENYYTAFSNAVQNLPYPDTSLSVAGKAADSAATGAALNGKAPAGYGLGIANAPYISDCNTVFENGWYNCAGGANAPFGKYGWMLVITGQFTRQEFFTNLVDPEHLVRHYVGGQWSEWEYVNPTMQVGVEYRTTERCDGKPVYAKLVSYYVSATIGNTTAITDVEIPHGISNYGGLVRCEAKISSSPLPVFYSGTAITCVKQVDWANVVLRIINDTWPNGTFEFYIYYTKS